MSAYYGKPLETDHPNATSAWLAGLAANGPLLTDGDDRISEAVGAAAQTEPFFGLMSSAKFRDIEGKGFHLAPCADLDPWAGWTYTKLALIATGSDSPNAAKLFVRYVLTEEGIGPQMADGKMPTRTSLSLPPEDEPSGLANFKDKLAGYDSATGLDDYDLRQDWQDFWRLNYKKNDQSTGRIRNGPDHDSPRPPRANCAGRSPRPNRAGRGALGRPGAARGLPKRDGG